MFPQPYDENTSTVENYWNGLELLESISSETVDRNNTLYNKTEQILLVVEVDQQDIDPFDEVSFTDYSSDPFTILKFEFNLNTGFTKLTLEGTET